jgi:hypothetical protein
MADTNPNDISAYLGMTPAQLDALMSQFQPSEEDKRASRQQAAFAAAAGLLGNMYKPTGMGLAAGIQGGLLGYNSELKDRTQQRGQNLTQAIALRRAGQDAQAQARRNMFADQLSGIVSPQSSGQTVPQQMPQQAPQGQGMPQIPSGALPGINTGAPPPLPQQMPQQSMSQQGNEPPLVKQLLDMGIPPAAIQAAGASDNPIATIQLLIKEYNQPHFGQGKIPLIRTREGFKAANVEGGNAALAAQVSAEETAKGLAQNPFQIVKGLDAQGREVQGYAPQLYGAPPVPGAQRPPTQFNLQNPTPQDLAAIAADMRAQGISGGPPQLGGPMVGPNPIEQATKMGAVASQTAQNTDISKTFGENYSKAVQAEFQAPGNIAKYEQMKSYLSNVNTGKAAPTVQKLKAYASYFAPDLAKEWTNETPYAQAATSFANELALQLRNPASGAGMPGNLSNTDRDFLVSMIAGVGNDPRAIPIMIDARVAMEKRNQEIGKMARAYRQKNGTIDENFYQQVQEFADTHPIFPPVESLKSQAISTPKDAIEAEMRKRGLLK